MAEEAEIITNPEALEAMPMHLGTMFVGLNHEKVSRFMEQIILA